jgi:hypothetical protein
MMPTTTAASVVVRTGWGLLLLFAPRRVLAAAGHPRPSIAAENVTRVLGARHHLQSGVITAKPLPAVVEAGAFADALHALSAAALAAVSPRWRTAAVGDALIAGSFAILGQPHMSDPAGGPRRPPLSA